MRINLSDIGKHLVALLAQHARGLTRNDIDRQLPNADRAAVDHELRLLVESMVILLSVRGHDRRLIYVLSKGFASLHEELTTESDPPACAPYRASTSDSLFAAAAHNLRADAATNDKPAGERSIGKTVLAFNAVTGRDLSEAEGRLLLQLLNDVSTFQRPREVEHV